jgi:uncharacterized Fe-S cluster protein YjdI
VTKRLQTYETADITVTFDPNVCIHSGVCVRGLPLVFDIKRKHWVRPDLASASDVATQVARCPSGALQYRLPTGEGVA